MLSHSDTSHMWSWLCLRLCLLSWIHTRLDDTLGKASFHLPPVLCRYCQPSVIMLLGEVRPCPRPRPGRVQTKRKLASNPRSTSENRLAFFEVCMVMAQAF